ncbi:hypothetical protein GCK32_014993 [Trichostrongylus colubriformis]|uniref:Uncharacterized protein n=1 Tax=Trichostrongylus colubriformis TaxID=6319 RepID=A0AAN8J1U7_TRICO
MLDCKADPARSEKLKAVAISIVGIGLFAATIVNIYRQRKEVSSTIEFEHFDGPVDHPLEIRKNNLYETL